MKISDFPLLTDENLQPEFVDFLIEEGFDVKDVKKENLFGLASWQFHRQEDFAEGDVAAGGNVDRVG